jgi:hypothetical protein
MTSFIYIAYGPSPYIRLELLYSLSTLLFEYATRPIEVLIYTDNPISYAHLDERIQIVDIAAALDGMTRAGALPHRVKPCVLLDAMRSRTQACVLLDTDSYVAPGFADLLAQALSRGAAMVLREGPIPHPELVGFQTHLPHYGLYAFNPLTSVMFNSGLVAVDPRTHVPVIEDVISLIDALLDNGITLFTIEQVAFSEMLRLHRVDVATMHPAFQHYFRRSVKRYMHWQLTKSRISSGALDIGPPAISHAKIAVRIFNYVNRISKKY